MERGSRLGAVSGANGTIINAGTADRVILRNIRVMGINTGLVGIKIFAAAVLSIENWIVTQFAQQGISDAWTAGNTKLFIRNTVVNHTTRPPASALARRIPIGS